MQVLVESAIKLDGEQIKAVTNLLTKKVGKGVVLTNVVNPDVLGGLRLSIGSKRIDVSLVAKLDQIKKQLE